MLDEVLRTVAELYDEHRQAAFPRLIVDDANGVEMVSLDSNVSGCVHTWLRNGGRIDDFRWDVLSECEQQLNHAILALGGDEASYYLRLLEMTVLILKVPRTSHRDGASPESIASHQPSGNWSLSSSRRRVIESCKVSTPRDR